MLIDLWADTERKFLGVGDFFIEHSSDGWEFISKDSRVGGTCETLFEAIATAQAYTEHLLSDKLDAMTANGGAS